MIVHLYIPSHLKRFLCKEFFEGKCEPFAIDSGSLIGKYIETVVHEEPSLELEGLVQNDTFSLVRFFFSSSFSQRTVRRARIDSFLEKYMKHSLIVWVKAQQRSGENRYNAVLSFLEYYEIGNQWMERYYQYVSRFENIPFQLYRDGKKENPD